MMAGIAQITMITTITVSPANGTVAAAPDTHRRIRSPRLRSALAGRATRAGPAGSPPARRRTRIMLARDARDRGVDLGQDVGGQRHEDDRAQIVLSGSSARRDGPFEEGSDGESRVRGGDLRRVDDQVLEVEERGRLGPGLAAAVMVVMRGCTKLPEAFSNWASPRPSTSAVDSTLTPT